MIEKITYGYGEVIKTISLEFKTVSPNELKEAITIEGKGLYLIHGSKGSVIYVGESMRLKARLQSHIRGHDNAKYYYKGIEKISYCKFDCEVYERRLIEGILIAKYQPLYNSDDMTAFKNRSESRQTVELDQIYHILYYSKLGVKQAILEEHLQIKRATIQNYVSGVSGADIELPEDFKPIIVIDIDNKENIGLQRVNKEVFNEVRAMLELGLKHVNIADKLNIHPVNVTYIKQLKYKKFQQWEQERQEALEGITT